MTPSQIRECVRAVIANGEFQGFEMRTRHGWTRPAKTAKAFVREHLDGEPRYAVIAWLVGPVASTETQTRTVFLFPPRTC